MNLYKYNYVRRRQDISALPFKTNFILKDGKYIPEHDISILTIEELDYLKHHRCYLAIFSQRVKRYGLEMEKNFVRNNVCDPELIISIYEKYYQYL